MHTAVKGLVGYLSVLWIGFHAFVVWYEEPTLQKLFGLHYKEYCQTTPRWMPRMRRRP